jgi:hypothetical protein
MGGGNWLRQYENPQTRGSESLAALTMNMAYACNAEDVSYVGIERKKVRQLHSNRIEAGHAVPIKTKEGYLGKVLLFRLH